MTAVGCVSRRALALEPKERTRLQTMVDSDRVVVFMKGSPAQPMCGFSKLVCKILEMHGTQFTSHDVLQDENLRTNIKEFSEWPTIPQVYIGKEFVGGSDIMLELHQSGQLVDKLKSVGIKSRLSDESAKNTA